MPAADQAGYAGLHDQVDWHMWEKFGNAFILPLGSAGIQLSQGTGQSSNGYNAQQIGAAAIRQQFGELGQEYARSGLGIPNTLTVRPGYAFVVQVTKDIVLRPYVDRRTALWRPGYQSRAGDAVRDDLVSSWTIMVCTLLQADEPARMAQLARMGAWDRAFMKVLMQRVSGRADVALRQFLAIRVKGSADE